MAEHSYTVEAAEVNEDGNITGTMRPVAIESLPEVIVVKKLWPLWPPRHIGLLRGLRLPSLENQRMHQPVPDPTMEVEVLWHGFSRGNRQGLKW